jgi:PQQ-like domain
MDLGAGATNWTFKGDDGLRSNVLVANGFVYVGSASGSVYALAESSGQQVWSDNVGAPLLWTNESEGTRPATGMAIGEGLLAVPASNLLTVYASCGATCPAPGGTSVVDPGPHSSFWFAAGSTASGFGEQLQLYSPHAAGPATIDYYTGAGKTTTTVQLGAGQPLTVDVAGAVGTGGQVGAHVQLPGPGVAERILHFPVGSQQGSSDRVGASATSNAWDFAAGSTSSTTDETLSLLNPGTSAVSVNLWYITDAGSSTKTLDLAPQTPTSVEVFSGDPTTNVASCTPNGAGANCGVGRGIAGVSVVVTAQNSAQIVAERSLSVNGYDFGSGPVTGGDTSFGTDGQQDSFYFAAGNTLPGFGQHLVLLNMNGFKVANYVGWFADSGAGVQKEYDLPANSRLDIDLADPTAGAGPGHTTVSAFVNAYPGVLAERETLVVHDFGGGTVTGVQTSYGGQSTTAVNGFAAGSTLPGDAGFLTIFAAAGPAVVTVTLDAGTGPVRHVLTLADHSTAVLSLSDPDQGIGPGNAQVAAVVTGSIGVVVEKTTYSANASTFGATDTMPARPLISGYTYLWAQEFF